MALSHASMHPRGSTPAGIEKQMKTVLYIQYSTAHAEHDVLSRITNKEFVKVVTAPLDEPMA